LRVYNWPFLGFSEPVFVGAMNLRIWTASLSLTLVYYFPFEIIHPAETNGMALNDEDGDYTLTTVFLFLCVL
jgi:hypothetical protein